MFKFPWLKKKPKEISQKKRSDLEIAADALPLGAQVKRCPKCLRSFQLQAVICDYDSTLLMLNKLEFQILLQPVTAKHLDGSPLEFQCTRALGKGGMCEVFEAYDTSTQDRYAIKILVNDLVYDAKSAKKFIEGAGAAIKLEHENIVRIHAIGDIPTAEAKSMHPMVVCDFVEGKTLSSLITKNTLPPVADVLELSRQICKALSYAHDQGIIHGDLKPTNIFVLTDGEKLATKVCDFAVAERLFRGLEWDVVSTMTTSIYGCSTYLAPDFIDSRQSTVVTDIYSLGCIMYECLTGKPPFTIGNDFGIMMAHRDEAPRPLSAEYTPKAVADIVIKALEKDPRRRWQSAAEMGNAIDQCKAFLK